MAWWKKDAFQEGQVAEWQELATPEGLPYFFNTKTNATTWERPDCLKSQEELLGGGNTWVWAPHDEHCFVPAQITGERDGTIHLVSRDGQQLTLRSGTHTERLQLSSLARIVPDLVLLDTMNNPLILHNLRSRFERDEIYVRCFPPL
jgi:myosin heavy subunit